MQISKQKTKTLITRPNSRSSDAISPNYIYGCGGGCFSYCYVARNNKSKVYINTNTEDIFKSVSNWVDTKVFPKIPNQQHLIYYIIDIGCSSDLALYHKHIDLESIMLDYDNHEKLTSTFATKYSSMLKLDVNHFKKNPRVRISLMPQDYSSILEPKTTLIQERIEDVNRLQELGWEVHLNFSPVIVYPGALKLYEKLFENIDKIVKNKNSVLSEVIFLTHNTDKHNFNIQNNINGEELLWNPDIQRIKKSEYAAGNNLRYEPKLKNQLIREFEQLKNEIIPWCLTRYIF